MDINDWEACHLFSLKLIFYIEDEGDALLRNVGNHLRTRRHGLKTQNITINTSTAVRILNLS